MPSPAVIRRIESSDRRSCAVLRINGWRRNFQVAAGKVTVYVCVAAKVAPIYVRMDFLRSTGVVLGRAGSLRRSVVTVFGHQLSKCVPFPGLFGIFACSSSVNFPGGCIQNTPSQRGRLDCACSLPTLRSGIHIDAEGPRIENGLERVLGTYGWAVICP